MVEEVVEEAGAGRGGEEVEEEEAAGEAGSGGKPAQEAGNGGRATAAGRGGTTTRWSRRPAPTPTATWSSWLWRTGWVQQKQADVLLLRLILKRCTLLFSGRCGKNSVEDCLTGAL